MSPTTIGLSMIVRDEAHCIVRGLDSLRGFIDYVCIVDTGSTDGTQDVIRTWLKQNNIPGEVVDEPWQDFAYNRTFALRRLRRQRHIDYALINDADDCYVFDDSFDLAAFKASMTADEYQMTVVDGGHCYPRTQIVRNAIPYEYRGVLHEFLQPLPGSLRAIIRGCHIVQTHDGARSRRADKFARDAAVLEQALTNETDPLLVSRYTFYLAQSYKDGGEDEKAVAAYLRRADMGFWDHERYASLLYAGRLMTPPRWSANEALATLLLAAATLPLRGEAWCAAAMHCRRAGRYEAGYRFARLGLDTKQGVADLYAEPWVYDYGLLDEVEVCASWTSRNEEALAICERLLSEGKLPPDDQARVEENAQALREKLATG